MTVILVAKIGAKMQNQFMHGGKHHDHSEQNEITAFFLACIVGSLYAIFDMDEWIFGVQTLQASL
jgi:hypothetical protein